MLTTYADDVAITATRTKDGLKGKVAKVIEAAE